MTFPRRSLPSPVRHHKERLLTVRVFRLCRVWASGTPTRPSPKTANGNGTAGAMVRPAVVVTAARQAATSRRSFRQARPMPLVRQPERARGDGLLRGAQAVLETARCRPAGTDDIAAACCATARYRLKVMLQAHPEVGPFRLSGAIANRLLAGPAALCVGMSCLPFSPLNHPSGCYSSRFRSPQGGRPPATG